LQVVIKETFDTLDLLRPHQTH